MRRLLLITGLCCLLLALAWPYLQRSGWWKWIGHLPGDIRIEREGSSFYFPLATCLLLSVLISLLFWIFRR